MSVQLIQKYYTEIDKIIRYGGSRNESSLRKPFQDLLEGYARANNLVLVAEAEKFNIYQFAEYKEQVIDLLKKVCTVSVETMKIVKEMP